MGSPGDSPLTFSTVYRVLGPTFPGRLDDQGIYWLTYPGLALAFPVPKAFHSQYAQSEELPLELPDGTTPVVSALRLHHPSCDPFSYQLPGGALEEVQLRPAEGLHFPSTELTIRYGASPQEVQTELGPPDRICYKPGVPPVVAGAEVATEQLHDYFYNYFRLGLDILFSGHRHEAKKFVTHANFPGHRDFNQYSKCLFRLQTDAGLLPPDATWGEAEEALGEPLGGKPLVHKEDLKANPFGAASFYGYPQCVLEVMDNGCIATVTIHE